MMGMPRYPAQLTRSTPPARQRGVAMMLVVIALAMAMVLCVGFLSTQSTSVGVAQNIAGHTQARAIAEQALQTVLAQIQASNAWRDDHTEGVWMTNQPLNGGTYSVTVQDGQDTDGDGVVEGDGDLSDDNNDVVTVTVVGSFGGVTHRIQAVVAPGEVLAGPITLLMIVNDPNNLSDAEETRQDLIESWGWTVRLLAGSSTVGEYATAMAGAHVVYVPEDGASATVAARLAATELGVVTEDGGMVVNLDLATTHSSGLDDAIRIVDNTHYITAPFGIGEVTIGTAARQIEYPVLGVVGGMRQLGWFPGTERRTLAALDAGQPLTDGTPSPGRRALAPFSGFDADELTSDGQMLLKRTLEWSAQSSMTSDAVTALGNWDTDTSVSIPNGEDRVLMVAVTAETHCSITSATYGYQDLTLVASAYESTGVGARTYVYYLSEAGIDAASDSNLRFNWSSGSRDDTRYVSRVYQHVNQANPIRTSEWATNAGPATIACAPVGVTRGDLVFSSVIVGHENRSYSWDSPLVEGVDLAMSTSTRSTADYAVGNGVTAVTAAATTNAPNRQSMVTAVLQPRSNSTGEGIIPQLLALYEFDEHQPECDLVGHWTFDDNGSGGVIAIEDDVDLNNSARIDAYRSSAGAYSGSNSGLDVTLVTNTSNSGSINLSSSAYLQGSTYNYPGANPTNVVSINNSAVITGNRYEQSVAFNAPSIPSTIGSGSNTTVNGNTTINSNRTYNDWTINSGTVTISGNITIKVMDDFVMNGGQIVIPSGSSLTLYVADDATLNNSAAINSDSTAANRFALYMYGSSGDLVMNDDSVMTGMIAVGRDLTLNDNAVIQGGLYVRDDLRMDDSSRLRIDLDQPGFGILPVLDDTGVNHAQAHGGVTFNNSGARAFTGSSLYFDGSDDFVRIAHHDDYLLNNGTVSFWFKSDLLLGTRGLFSKASSNYDSGGHLEIYTDFNVLKVRLQTNGESPYGTGNDFVLTSSGLSSNTWYHVLVTFGAGGLRLYRNGALVASNSYPGGLGPNSGGIGNYQPIAIGASTANAGFLTHLPLSGNFVGYIDDVRIYNSVLDAAQVSRLYQGQPIGDRTEPSYLVLDTSGLGSPLDLSIDNTNNVTWPNGGGLTINQPTVLRAGDRPDKLRNGIAATGEFTIEMIVTPASTSGNGRLFWYGPNSGSNTNLDIYRSGAHHSARLRTSDTTANPAAVDGEDGLSADGRVHVLVCYNGEHLRIFHDGAMVAEQALTGGMLAWDTAYGLTLANLPQGGSGWLGTFERVAVYDRDMNQRQINNLLDGLPPGDGASVTQGGSFVHWVERP